MFSLQCPGQSWQHLRNGEHETSEVVRVTATECFLMDIEIGQKQTDIL